MNNLVEQIDAVLNDVIGQNHVSEIVQFREGTLSRSQLLELLSRSQIDRKLIEDYNNSPYHNLT